MPSLSFKERIFHVGIPTFITQLAKAFVHHFDSRYNKEVGRE